MASSLQLPSQWFQQEALLAVQLTLASEECGPELPVAPQPNVSPYVDQGEETSERLRLPFFKC